MEVVTFVVLLVVALLFIYFIYRRQQLTVDFGTAKQLFYQWDGWVEISNNEYKPLFQGKIFGKARGGLLLAGILVAENTPAALLEAIKETNPSYTTDGSILARGISAHDQKFIMSQLEQKEIIALIEPHLINPEAIKTCLILSSAYFDHMDNPKGMLQFNEVWNNLTKPEEA